MKLEEIAKLQKLTDLVGDVSKALSIAAKYWDEVSDGDELDQCGSQDYPFQHSFEDTTGDVYVWHQSLQKEVTDRLQQLLNEMNKC